MNNTVARKCWVATGIYRGLPSSARNWFKCLRTRRYTEACGFTPPQIFICHDTTDVNVTAAPLPFLENLSVWLRFQIFVQIFRGFFVGHLLRKTSIRCIELWRRFWKYYNIVFLLADTKSIIQTHTFCTTVVNKNRLNRTFHNSVGGWITGVERNFWLHAYAHAQSNIQQIKYAEKTDD